MATHNASLTPWTPSSFPYRPIGLHVLKLSDYWAAIERGGSRAVPPRFPLQWTNRNQTSRLVWRTCTTVTRWYENVNHPPVIWKGWLTRDRARHFAYAHLPKGFVMPENLLPLSNALRFYALQTKPNIQLWQAIRSANQVLDLKNNYWRLSVRRSNINPA